MYFSSLIIKEKQNEREMGENRELGGGGGRGEVKTVVQKILRRTIVTF